MIFINFIFFIVLVLITFVAEQSLSPFYFHFGKIIVFYVNFIAVA